MRNTATHFTAPIASHGTVSIAYDGCQYSALVKPGAAEVQSVLQDLERPERMRLMKFVCSFAWADLQIQPGEREFIARMVKLIDLDREERAQVDRWLEVPPHPQEVDPTSIPLEHRATFVESVVGLIESDGVVSQEERDNLELFENLLL